MPKEPATIRARGDDRQEHACSCSALPKAAAYPQPRPTAGTDMGKHQPLASLSHPEISYQFTDSFICGSRIILRLPKNCLFLLPGQLKQIFENFQFTRKKHSWLGEVPEVIVREAVSRAQRTKVTLSPRLHGGLQVPLQISLSQGDPPWDLHTALHGIGTALRTHGT